MRIEELTKSINLREELIKLKIILKQNTTFRIATSISSSDILSLETTLVLYNAVCNEINCIDENLKGLGVDFNVNK